MLMIDICLLRRELVALYYVTTLVGEGGHLETLRCWCLALVRIGSDLETLLPARLFLPDADH